MVKVEVICDAHVYPYLHYLQANVSLLYVQYLCMYSFSEQYLYLCVHSKPPYIIFYLAWLFKGPFNVFLELFYIIVAMRNQSFESVVPLWGLYK